MRQAMGKLIDNPILSDLSNYLASQMGLYFPRERWQDLERGIQAAANEFGFLDEVSCAQWLMSESPTQKQIEVLASHLTIGETYFCRERASLDALRDHILPELLAASCEEGRPIRIWSAGCSTGEEPYSIAMLLDWAMPRKDRNNVSILATDINPVFLRKASEGIYGEWSFRGTPNWIRERYFTKRKDGRMEIHPRIREKVSFRYLNLANDAYPSISSNTNGMDVIFCRNVLMYFSPQCAGEVAQKFYRSLANKGWLIVSPVETSNTLFASFTAVAFPSAVVYRKDAGGDPGHSSVSYSSSAPSAAGSLSSLPARMEIEPHYLGFIEPVQALAPLETSPVDPVPEPAIVAAEIPPSGSSLSRMAQACANQGKLNEAIVWCEKAIVAEKLNPAHQYLIAVIQQELGLQNDAVRSLGRALYLDPDFVLAHFALGNHMLSQSRQREAERHFLNALALLYKKRDKDILPESDGMTAGRLAKIIEAVLSSLPQPASTQ
jgi:chemotaxis protein methyltransferase CheR